jgi:uncharacterized protein (TIGR00290 family)
MAQIDGLFTTLNGAHRRVSMHAVPEELLRAQAETIGMPLTEIYIPHPCPAEQYCGIMGRFLAQVKSRGVQAIAFGDLNLEDVREYRERQMRNTGVAALFPNWGTPTATLARDLIEKGFRMIVTCVDPRFMPRESAGAAYDDKFLEKLPRGVDPCGENGEFHTFVFDGPIFKKPLDVRVGDIVERNGFVFADIA